MHAQQPEGRASALTAAIDIGGTKIAGALVTGTGQLVARVQRPTPVTTSAAEVQAAVTACVTTLACHGEWAQVSALGVCSAGPVDRVNGTASPVNIPAWREYPLVRTLKELPELSGMRLVYSGDAVAMTAAEHRFGAARGHANALCVVVSTGVGAGLVLDGEVRSGPSGNAGHLGHISVDLAGELCPCGSRGCLERLASGGAITRYALSLGWRTSSPEPTAADVAAGARAGDAAAIAAFDRAGRALAAGIAATSTLLEVEATILGGGVMHASDLLLPAIQHHLGRYAALPFARTEVRAAALGTDAGLVGAAVLASAN